MGSCLCWVVVFVHVLLNALSQLRFLLAYKVAAMAMEMMGEVFFLDGDEYVWVLVCVKGTICGVEYGDVYVELKALSQHAVR